MTSPRGTLLIFWRGSVAEQQAKSLLPESHIGLERRFYRAGLARLIACGHEVGLRVVVCSPAAPEPSSAATWIPQPPAGSFGTRLARAIASVDDLRGGPLLVAAADVPGLDTRVLSEALTALATEDAVLGPSPDGGIYLLGLSRPLDLDLTRIRWCTPFAARDLGAALVATGTKVARLAPRRDLDTRRDLARALAESALGRLAPALVRALRSALAPTPPRRLGLVAPRSPWCAPAAHLRGPPTLTLG